MWCLVTFNKILFFTLQKGGGIACVNYLKVKYDVTHWKAIISDKNQIHAAPNFLLLGSYTVIVPRNNLLHTAAPGYKERRKQ